MSGLEVVAARVPEEARSGCRDRRHRLVAQVLPKVRAVFRGCASTRGGIAYVRVREERAAEGTDEAAQGAQIGRIARELTGVAGCAALASRIAGALHGPASAARRSAARRSVTRGDVVNDVDRRPFASAAFAYRVFLAPELPSTRRRPSDEPSENRYGVWPFTGGGRCRRAGRCCLWLFEWRWRRIGKRWHARHG